MFKPKVGLINGKWWVVNLRNINVYDLTNEETVNSVKAFIYCRDRNNLEGRW